MSTFSSIAIICFILFSWNQMTDGLACYLCTSCNDPFNPTNVFVAYYNESIAPYYCVKTSTAYNITRGVSQTCSPSGTVGNGQWCCQTNLCNTANKNILTNTFSFGIYIFIFMIVF